MAVWADPHRPAVISPDCSPYDVLGISEPATPDEIRRAYRRCALEHHPDRNPGDPMAQEAFLAVRAAYERLQAGDPDAGYDVDRVVAEAQRVAHEVRRRRSRAGETGRAWQQVQVELLRTPRERAVAALHTRQFAVGVVGGVALAGLVGVALAPVAGLFGAAVSFPWWLLSILGGTLGVAVIAWATWTAELDPWAAEVHWQGLRDLRWGVVVDWGEIQAVREADGALDLILTDVAARRLAPLVPSVAFAAPAVYRLPIGDATRLAGLVRAQIGT